MSYTLRSIVTVTYIIYEIFMPIQKNQFIHDNTILHIHLLVFSVHSHNSCSSQPKVVLQTQSSTRNLALACLTT